MSGKEATARIKINKLLEAAGWRFFPKDGASANICLESKITIKSADLVGHRAVLRAPRIGDRRRVSSGELLNA